MKVQVNLFANLRKYAPGGEDAFDVELDLGATAGQLVETLKIPQSVQLVILINGRQAKRDNALADGDTVTLFPPIAGGLRIHRPAWLYFPSKQSEI